MRQCCKTIFGHPLRQTINETETGNGEIGTEMSLFTEIEEMIIIAIDRIQDLVRGREDLVADPQSEEVTTEMIAAEVGDDKVVNFHLKRSAF